MRGYAPPVSAQFQQSLKERERREREKDQLNLKGVLPFHSNLRNCPLSAPLRVGVIRRGALCGYVHLSSKTPLHGARSYSQASQ
jgi:hypothetical protein